MAGDGIVTGEDAPKRRAQRQGWHVSRRGDRFRARAFDPHEGRERERSFATEAEAKLWARAMRSKLDAKVEQSGRAPARAMLDLYLAYKRKRIHSDAHYAEVKRVLESAIAAGLTDLRDVTSSRLAIERWIERARALHRAEEEDDDSPAQLAPRTLNRYLDTVRAFGKWAVRFDHIAKSPFAVVEDVPVPDLLKPVFRIEEIRTLVDPAHLGHDAFLWFASMAYLGLRQGEAANIDYRWLLWRERMVRVTWSASWDLKRQKERLVPMPAEFAELVRAHAKLTGRLAGGGDIGALIGHLSPTMPKMDRKARQRRFDDLLTAAHVPVDRDGRARTPHSARHTWTCLMLATGEPETLVKLYAGHEKLETTSEYARSMVQFRREVEGWTRGEIRYRNAA